MPKAAMPRGRTTTTAVGYCRRSTDRQEQSIPDQRAAIERYCEEQGLRMVDWYVDDAISGTRAGNRPAFQRLVADAQKGAGFGAVVCYDVKRFGRLDNDEAGYYRHMLRTCGVEVHYASEGFGGDDTDDLLRPVKQWQARQESKDLSKVTIRGLLSKAESGGGGWWMGGAPPHGYDLRYESDRGEFLFRLRFLPDGSKQILTEDGVLQRTLDRGERVSVSKRDRARLVPSAPERVETIKEIFRLYTEERRGLAAIADCLNRRGVPTPRGPKWSAIYAGLWRDSTVRAILVNPVYQGDLAWNRRSDGKFHRIAEGRAVERREAHGARLVPNDQTDWLVVRDAHDGLVSRRTWAQAQAIREGRAAPQERDAHDPVGGWSGKRARFLLSGLVVCERCGGKYQGVTRTKGARKNNGQKIKTRYYGCGSYIARGRSGCASLGAIPQEELEAQVINEVLAFYRERYGGPEGRERLAKAVREHLGAEAADLAGARERLEAERERAESTIASLLDNMTAATRDLVEERLAALRLERERLRTRAEELERLSLAEAEVADAVHEAAAFLAGLEVTLRKGPNEARKAAIRRCVDRIGVTDSLGRHRLKVQRPPLR